MFLEQSKTPKHDERTEMWQTLQSRSAAALSRYPASLSGSALSRFALGYLITLATARVASAALVPFFETTEARYAEIARKMLETGDWITPQFSYGVPFWGKPPLHTWLSAAGMGTLGVNEFAARFPILILAVAILAMLYQWARSEKGTDFALAGTVVLASSALFFVASAVVMTDLVLTFATTTSMICFWKTMHSKTGAPSHGHLFFVALGLGLLAKGPVTLLITGLPIALWLAMTKRWQEALHRIPWLTGTLAMLVLAAPWYVAAEVKTPGFLSYFLVGEHLDRFLVSGWQGNLYGFTHIQPRGAIWLFFLIAFLPWSVFFVWPLFRLRIVRRRFREDTRGWRHYLLFWTLSPLLLFTPAHNIIIPYVLPAIPAATLLLVQTWWDSNSHQRLVTARTFRGFKRISIIFLALPIAILAVPVVGQTYLFGKSSKWLVAEAERIAPADAGPLLCWRGRRYSAEFYTRGQSINVTSPAELASFLTDGRRNFLAVQPALASEIPSSQLARFELIGLFGRDLLFLESAGHKAP